MPAIDQRANDTGREDSDLSAPGATVRTMVITAREDLQIAHEARWLLGGGPSPWCSTEF